MFSTTARRAALATATAGAAAAALLAAPATAAADTPGRALDRVPADFAPWVHAAPLLCPAAQISPAFIATQLDAESGFDAAAVGPAGQAGPAQLTPQTAAAFLVDTDLSGTASPHESATPSSPSCAPTATSSTASPPQASPPTPRRSPPPTSAARRTSTTRSPASTPARSRAACSGHRTIRRGLHLAREAPFVLSGGPPRATAGAAPAPRNSQVVAAPSVNGCQWLPINNL